jgi:hypothetical protein
LSIAAADGEGVRLRETEQENRFRAAPHASAAYMVKGLSGTGPARCVFSMVLVKALCGVYQEAVESRGEETGVVSAHVTKNLAATQCA